MSTHTIRKAAIDEIFEYVESHDKRLHRLDIVAALPHIPPATVDSSLIKLATNEKIARPARGYYQRKSSIPKAAPPPAPETPTPPAGSWHDKSAPMGARVLAFLRAGGPTPRRDVEQALGLGAKQAIDDMVRAGDIYFTGGNGATIAIGTREPQGQAAPAARRWNEERPASWRNNPAAQDQLPPPSNSGRTKVLDLVLQDFKDRADKGLEKYGTALFTENGRDALLDAYQEAIDLCMYLRQAIEEQREKGRPLDTKIASIRA